MCLTNGAFAENCYILADPASRDAVLIDPGEEADLFLRRLDTEGLTLRAVWLTHAHLDHILGVDRVVTETGVPVYLHPADRPLYDAAPEQGAWLGVRAATPPAPSHALADGDRLPVGQFAFEVRGVPGHSPGGVAFIGQGIAFVGDALFAGSIGRTDLPGGDAALLLRSIRDVLLALPDETVVYAGHGPETTIGSERRNNPFLTGMVKIV
ncbi:MAG: MBL fold metallo-hydrolase [Gemmatimonadetes bacterium]|nr:MBL fold metallo-hydrolase [Gemmatimonadota bacterium]